MLSRGGMSISTHAALLITIAATTVSWVLAAYLAPQTDPATLTAFYRKVRPFGPGWAQVSQAAGPLPDEGDRENIPMALLGWVTGCAAIWSALFAVGNFLYGRLTPALILTAIFLVSGFTVMRIVSRLWRGAGTDTAAVR